MGTYNSDPSVNTLAQAVAQDADAKGRVYSRKLELQSATADDFSKFEGLPESNKPVWVQKDLSADGGDIVKMTAMGGAGGPGVRGEGELTGNTSNIRIGGFTVQVDFWRDAVEFTKKQLKFLPAGKSIHSVALNMLSAKLGRQKQNDGQVCMIKKANGNIFRPGNRGNRDALLAVDGFTPSVLTEATARAKNLGARPVGIGKSKSGSQVLRYMAFSPSDALIEFRNSSLWSNAILQAAPRSEENPAFSGRLLDWQGHDLWEHIIVDEDVDDYIGGPLAPKAKLGSAITAGSATVEIKMSATNTKCLYFQFFPGYDYIFVEGQSAAPDSGVYYAWIIDPAQTSADAPGGKAMFVRYTGSANVGNKINAITQRLGPSTSGIENTTVGSITWDADVHTDNAGVGSWILPANAKGTVIGGSIIMGAGALLRAKGSIDAEPIEEKRDYGFVWGMGYEGIWGHNVAFDTQGLTRHYVYVQHAIEHPGIIVPGTWGV